MRTISRLATAGAGAAMLIGGIAGAASASTAQPALTACHLTVSHPTVVYKQAGFGAHYGGGKHTGDGVTSSWSCADYDNGFHQVNLSGGGDGWIYASDLNGPNPTPPVESRYKITGTVNVRNAPSTTYGSVISVKKAGQIVTSPLWKNDFSNNGFAEVLMGNGNIGWISSAYVE